MAVFISVSKPFDIVDPLIEEYLRPQGPRVGTTRLQSEEEKRHLGKREGIAIGLAYLLTERRANQYEYLVTVKQVMEYDVMRRLNEFTAEWVGADKQKCKELIDEAKVKLYELAYDDEHEDLNTGLRRKGILEGNIDPSFATEDDMAFFRAERDKQLAAAERLGMLTKTDKVNR